MKTTLDWKLEGERAENFPVLKDSTTKIALKIRYSRISNVKPENQLHVLDFENAHPLMLNTPLFKAERLLYIVAK